MGPRLPQQTLSAGARLGRTVGQGTGEPLALSRTNARLCELLVLDLRSQLRIKSAPQAEQKRILEKNWNKMF